MKPAAAAAARSSDTGLRPTSAAVLAYSAWWVTGGLMLLVERRDPFVRFHAWQALAGLGGLWLAGMTLLVVSVALNFYSTGASAVALAAALLVWGAGIVLWGVCATAAWRGRIWRLPLAGAFAARRAGIMEADLAE